MVSTGGAEGRNFGSDGGATVATGSAAPVVAADAPVGAAAAGGADPIVFFRFTIRRKSTFFRMGSAAAVNTPAPRSAEFAAEEAVGTVAAG